MATGLGKAGVPARPGRRAGRRLRVPGEPLSRHHSFTHRLCLAHWHWAPWCPMVRLPPLPLHFAERGREAQRGRGRPRAPRESGSHPGRDRVAPEPRAAAYGPPFHPPSGPRPVRLCRPCWAPLPQEGLLGCCRPRSHWAAPGWGSWDRAGPQGFPASPRSARVGRLFGTKTTPMDITQRTLPP